MLIVEDFLYGKLEFISSEPDRMIPLCCKKTMKKSADFPCTSENALFSHLFFVKIKMRSTEVFLMRKFYICLVYNSVMQCCIYLCMSE